MVKYLRKNLEESGRVEKFQKVFEIYPRLSHCLKMCHMKQFGSDKLEITLMNFSVECNIFRSYRSFYYLQLYQVGLFIFGSMALHVTGWPG